MADKFKVGDTVTADASIYGLKSVTGEVSRVEHFTYKEGERAAHYVGGPLDNEVILDGTPLYGVGIRDNGILNFYEGELEAAS